MADHLLGLRVRIPPGARMYVCCECCVLSGRGLCNGTIPHTQESYQLQCVIVCNLQTSKNEAVLVHGGLLCQKLITIIKNKLYTAAGISITTPSPPEMNNSGCPPANA